MRIIESSFKQLYREYLESGLSVRDFCSNQDFAVSTFYRWKKLLEDNEPSVGFVPITINSKASVHSNEHHLSLISPCKETTHDSQLSFTFPNGTRLGTATFDWTVG
ncbi:IS66 family insertion sequence element accessory protein TnpA [Mangrovibacterium marinum]|uniref:IS66 family insertion sequence element accessory protein TnpA n=1 Tax=Mangrovibacterium marinum TaxID=1639118 RepID=UPI0038B3529A